MSQPVPKMMTEAELRKKLEELDSFWENEVKNRGRKIVPADGYWYIYTRQAYLHVLGEGPE